MVENLAARVTESYLQQKGWKCHRIGENMECIEATFDMDNREPMTVRMVFDDADDAGECSAHIFVPDFAKFPPEKTDSMYVIVNSLNNSFRWIKFAVREEYGLISAEDDAVLRLDSCGEEVLRCCIQLICVADEAYITVMKCIYA